MRTYQLQCIIRRLLLQMTEIFGVIHFTKLLQLRHLQELQRWFGLALQLQLQSVHFKHFAPEPKEYAVNRYDFEAWRHWNIIEERLGKHPYMLGDTYGIVDMALWPWARMIPRILNDDAFKSLPNVKRFLDEVSERPAAKRALELQSKHEFKTTLDDDARKAMFPSNERLKKAGA